MRPLDRRQFLTLAGAGAVVVPMLGLAACSSDTSSGGSGSGTSGSDTSNPVGPVKIGLSSSTLPTYITQIAGPLLYGGDFGLNVTKDDIVTFQSHATAVQAVLSGQLQVVAASTMANLSVIAQGSPFKIFQPYILVDDYIIASTGDIQTLDDIKTKNATVGIDSEGGAARTAMDAILFSKNAGFFVGDLENIQGIESSGQRESALANGQVQVSLIHVAQADQVSAAGKDVHNLGSLYEAAPNYIKESYAAPQAWLDANQATAAALSASVIKASRELSSNEETFLSAVKQLLAQPPSDDQLAEAFKLIGQYNFWPASVTGLETERVKFMLELGAKEGLLTNDSLTPESVVDMRPNDAAQKLVGAPSSSMGSSVVTTAPTTQS